MENTENKGIRLRLLNRCMIIIAIALSIILTYAAFRAIASYRDMQEATERYIQSEQDAFDLQAGSDYLTEQVRAFAISGDPERVTNYFEEVYVTRRRDNALESLSVYLSGTESYRVLSEALNYSNELMLREYYAMRLTIEARGYELSGFPEELQQVELSAEDLALSAEEQSSRAREMVLDEVYQSYKDKISQNVSLCAELLTGEMRREQLESSDHLLTMLWAQAALIAVLVLMVLLAVILTSQMLIHPLERTITHIEKKETLPETGAEELRFLARIYNQMFEQIRKEQDALSFEASHDALTGLYNRSAFEKLRLLCPSDSTTLLLIDLDYFKSINDTYGHETGDRALQKVAEVLRGSFRAEDHVCRIGGDEFAVIMVHTTSALKELVEGKVRAANETLSRAEDGLPAMSLSVGVAFGDRENPTEDMFKDADTALYRVKEGGRNGCAFY